MLIMFSAKGLLAETACVDKQSNAEVVEHIRKLQIPFIANNGQTNERVKFYANTFGGTVFVTKEGEIVYSLPASNGGELRDKRPETRSQKLEVGMRKSDARKQNKNFRTANSKSKTQNLNSQSEIANPQSEIQGVALKEEFVGAKVKTIQGEEKSKTKVNYFKGKDPSMWETNISTYDMVSFGEIYKGVELKLKAYGNNVEKLFCVKPGADPSQIKVRLSGVNPSKFPINKGGQRGLSVNEHGELVAETELGPVKFTKPVAYQEIDGKRVEVDVEYRIQKPENRSKNTDTNRINPKSAIYNPKLVLDFNRGSKIDNPSPATKSSSLATRHSSPTYSFAVASYDKTKDLIIDPLLASTYLGGSDNEIGYSLTLDTSGDVYVAGYTQSTDFPTTSGVYDTSSDGSSDVFISKLNSGLTSLLASTYLGGSDNDYGYSLALDTSGNVYVTGYTGSTDFPTTSGAYDTSLNGDYNVFISKLNSGLTSLLASTYLGGSGNGYGQSLTLDTSGNVYVTGRTRSIDFPITSGAYDTSFNGGDDEEGGGGDVFVSKLESGLTNLLASTYLGGSDNDYGYSLTLDTSGNVYVTGYTESTDFPTTSGAYDISGSYVAFVSKLDGGLTSLLASTYLGSSGEIGYSIALDTSWNVYVTGYTGSTDFPTTSGAYDASFNNGNWDVFVSKLDSGLTSLLASTYLGGSDDERGYSLALDTSGNVYVTGYTWSTDFPTTNGTYDNSFNNSGNWDVFVSKLNSGLTNLLASTYLGGSDSEGRCSLALDTSGNVYVTGRTLSTDFPITSGAYDTSLGGSSDAFVSKLDNNLSASPPTVTTGSATNITTNSATLNGTVNGNGLSTTVWFEYDTNSGSYNNTTATYGVSGSDDQSVSISISGLSSGTTYYYRLGARTDAGLTYGSEKSFETLENLPPSVITGYATSVTKDSATLDGAVNANGLSTTVWFEYGTYSGSYTNTSSTQSVSGTTASTVSINISGLSSGTTYFYRIVAQSSAGTSYGSEKSFKTVTDTTKLPKVTTGSATSVTSNSAKLDGIVNANNLETYAWFEYGTKSGSYGSVSSTQKVTGTSDTTVSISISGLSSATKYYYRIAAQNNSGTSYGSEKSFSTLDTSVPTGSISINGDAIYTKSTSVTLTLSAIDNSGVTGYYISNSSTKPSASATGWTSVTSTTSYSTNVSYTLSSGDGSKTVYVWYKDNSGNISNSASDSIILDMTAPTITITSPISDDNYTVTSSVIAIGGTASDSTSGVSSVTWSNDKGGSGTASGTTGWLTSSVSLLNGENIITVTATDGAGNTGTDKITVIYNTGTVSTPTQTPASSPTPTLTPTTAPSEKGIISGYVIDKKGYPVESARIRLKGTNSKVFKNAISDEDGLFEFVDLDADVYIITVLKKGYKRTKQTITLEEGEEKDVEIVMKKSRI